MKSEVQRGKETGTVYEELFFPASSDDANGIGCTAMTIMMTQCTHDRNVVNNAYKSP